MGLLASVFGIGQTAGNDGVALAAAFYAAHHVLVKGGLFLAVSVTAATAARRLWTVLVPAAVLALSLAGLPLTGGALAKLAVKSFLGDGVVGFLATLSAAGSMLLMLHFLRRLSFTTASDADRAALDRVAPSRLAVPWLATAAASVAVPVVVVAERAAGAARTTGEALERIDALLRQWHVAGVSLLTLAVVLAVVLLASS